MSGRHFKKWAPPGAPRCVPTMAVGRAAREILDLDRRIWQLETELEAGEVHFTIPNTQIRWGGFDFPKGMARPEKQSIFIPEAGAYKVTFKYYENIYSFEKIDDQPAAKD